jgi:hypothetical protein
VRRRRVLYSQSGRPGFRYKRWAKLLAPSIPDRAVPCHLGCSYLAIPSPITVQTTSASCTAIIHLALHYCTYLYHSPRHIFPTSFHPPNKRLDNIITRAFTVSHSLQPQLTRISISSINPTPRLVPGPRTQTPAKVPSAQLSMPVDSTYAPQSPDLSSFLSGSPSRTSATSNQPTNTGYTPQSPKFPPGNFSSPPTAPRFGSISSTSYQPPISLSNSPQNTYQPRTFGSFDYSAGAQGYVSAIPDLPASHDFRSNAQRNTSSFSQTQQLPHSYTNRPSFSAGSAYVPQPSLYSNLEQHKRPQSSSSSSDEMSGRGGRKKRENGTGAGVIPKNEPEDNTEGIATMSVFAGPSQGIEVKTKFPVARIKRIMQADEEVGKVAQVTPHAVCKLSFSCLFFSELSSLTSILSPS